MNFSVSGPLAFSVPSLRERNPDIHLVGATVGTHQVVTLETVVMIYGLSIHPD